MQIDKLTGPEKAAILLLNLGEDVASSIFMNLNDDEIQQLGSYMSEIISVPPKTAEDIIDEFLSLTGEDGFIFGGEKYLQNILTKALGENKAHYLIENLALYEDTIPFASLRRIDPDLLANYLRIEHPQTIAVILSFLDLEKSAQVLSQMPDALRADIIMRIINMDKVSPDAIKELEKIIKSEIKPVKGILTKGTDGLKVAADILNHVDRAIEDEILAKIEEVNTELSEEIRQLMFVFDDLVLIDDRGVQAVLKEISKEDLALSLKTANEEVKEKIFKNMSERAREMLLDDLEALGPVRLKDVERAQQTIVRVIRKLEEKGEVAISGRGEEDKLV
ncbi:MAG: flagellar motor switch protein FliG [Thermodesulfobacteriota bacterium]|nr:flagellar motor switch protein FliG [Thermodesulfobacteriota bacterium]